MEKSLNFLAQFLCEPCSSQFIENLTSRRCYYTTGNSHVRLFGKAQVDVNLSLGQFVKVGVVIFLCCLTALAFDLNLVCLATV